MPDGPTADDLRPVNYRGEEPQWCTDQATGVSGFKVFVGDLPTYTDAATFIGWIRASPQLGAEWAVRAQSHVDCGVRGPSGTARAICTVASAEAAYRLYNVAWSWWARVPPSVSVPRRWRWVMVRFFRTVA